MVKEVPLYKDKKYVKLLEKILGKLQTGFENKASYLRPSKKGGYKQLTLDSETYNRAVNALITQPDKAFLNTLEKFQDVDAAQLAYKIKQTEDGLLRSKQPLLGLEGHHIFHQNTVKRIRKLPIAAQLEVMDKLRKLGGTTGVVPENITYLGKIGHRANLLKDKVIEVTAHINPFNLKDDTGYWSKDYDFDPKMNLDEIADALHNEAFGPQAMLAKNAELRKSTVAAKNWFKKTLGGVDIFDPKIDPKLRKKYKTILNELRINFNDVERAFEEGRIPELPNKGKPIPIIQALKDNPDLISESKIGTFAKEGKLFKPLEQLGTVLQPIKPLAKKGAKYVLPVVGTAIASANRSAVAAEYEENPTAINLARKKIATAQVGLEAADTATFGATGAVTWIPNLLGDATEYILKTVQTPQTKDQSDKEIKDQLGDKFYTF